MKRTFVRVGVAVHVAEVVVVGVPGRENVFVAVAHGPVAEDPKQLLGILTELAPHEAGIMAFLALKAVRKAA